jgi:alpha-L-rhamnosidase
MIARRFISLVLLLACALELGASVRVTDLRCENAVDPLGIDVPAPRLSWRLESAAYGTRQTAWEVLVASSPERLAAGEGDRWSSGRVASEENFLVPYAGLPLRSSEEAFWKVRVWDGEGRVSAWSDPARWTMGKLRPEDWSGRWIAAETEAPSLLFRREFVVREGLRRAVLHVSGLGHYTFSCNGVELDEDLFTPGWTDYEVSTLYNTRELAALLRPGRNVLGFMLGDGMYRVEREPGRFTKFTGSFGPKRLIADLRLEYLDGRVEVIGTDDSWRWAPGPVTFSNPYSGEDHDARLEPEGWRGVGFDDAGWVAAVVREDSLDTLRGHRADVEPLRVREVRQPVERRPLAGPGEWLFDFGQNTTYTPRLRVSGPRGSIVRIIPSELVYRDGYPARTSMGGIHRGSAWWQYIKATDGEETWTPRFNFLGCRYMQAQCLPAEGGRERPTIESLEGLVVHASVEPAGTFATSNALINRIRDLIWWAQRSNMLSVLTDCPHREKLGWLEQYHLNGPAIRYEWNLARLFTKGMQDMADAQTPEGLIPNIAPEYASFRGTFRVAAEWGAAFLQVPWQQYQFYGDSDLLARHYPAMKRYFEYLQGRMEDGILSEGLGDWYDVGPRGLSRAELTLPPLTATAFVAYNAEALARIAEVLGEDDEAARFREVAAAVGRRFHEAFFDPAVGGYGSNAQAGNGLALAMGLVPPGERERVLANLIDDLEARGYAATAGDVGYRFVLRALAEADRHDVIFRMVTQDEHPGYAYQLREGATALTESWDARRTASHNHFMMGHVTEWFYGSLLGLDWERSAPGFGHLSIAPQPTGDLTWVEGSHRTPQGTVRIRWERGERTFSLSVTVPPNSTATVRMPFGTTRTVRFVDGPGPESPHVESLADANEPARFRFAPGRYTLQANL